MIKQLLKLIRVKQWYKNLLVFLPLFFSGIVFDVNLIPFLLAFFSLSFISSSYYILNDLKDLKQDRIHPEKKKRPLAAGFFSKTFAVSLFFILFFVGFFLAFNLGSFFFFAAGLFVFTLLYIFYLKKIAFLDIISISINFLIRTIAGAFVGAKTLSPLIELSPWLIFCVFFLALFLTSSKREADILFLKDKAVKHKKSFKNYSLEITSFICVLSVTMLLTVYSLYIVFVQDLIFIITLPIALFAIIKYYSLLKEGSIITRHPELMYKDKALFISVVLWFFVVLVLLYL
ncbi:MAG: UbiA family prenyltransferase [Candidatus Woesearchaeota archaeon]